MAEQRKVAGLWCTDVLDRLGAYVDDELSSEERQRVDAHLAECTWCESFGASYAETIVALKNEMALPEPLPSEPARRLQGRIATAQRGDDGSL